MTERQTAPGSPAAGTTPRVDARVRPCVCPRRGAPRHLVRMGVTAVIVAACSAWGAAAGAQRTSPAPRTTPGSTPAAQVARATTWPIKTREHVDLWLHGFAMLLNDSTPGAVPLFRRGYRDELTVLKNKGNVLTQLDVNVDRLRERLRASRTLFNAQFVPLYFSSLEEMRSTIEHFVAAGGNPNAAKSRNEAILFAMLAGYFPTPEDRSWLALFSSGLWDEEAKIYHSYWVQQQRERGGVIDSVQAMWQRAVLPRLQGFLNNTQQRAGDVLLCLPLDGEGRTLTGASGVHPVTGVTFPTGVSDAPNAIYTIAHELVAGLVDGAIRDNLSPAQLRAGVADQLASPAAVRTGLLLMEKFLPELADGYARYYVRAAGRTPGDTPRAQLAALFPIPDAIRDAIAQQLDVVQGGI